MIDGQDYLSDLLQQLRLTDASGIEKLLLDAAISHPADPRPLLLLAGEYAQAQDMDRAEATYIAALQRNPDYAIARFQLGLLQFSGARPAVALATFAPLDQLEEHHPLRLFKNAFECLAQDRLQDARTWFCEGIAHNTDNTPLNFDMQNMVKRLDKLQAESGHAAQDSAQAAAASTAPHPEKQSGNSPANQVEEHFLVSAYRNLH